MAVYPTPAFKKLTDLHALSHPGSLTNGNTLSAIGSHRLLTGDGIWYQFYGNGADNYGMNVGEIKYVSFREDSSLLLVLCT